MGFSTPAWIANLPKPVDPNDAFATQRAAVQAGYQQGQQKAMYGALNGVNLDDPASLNAAQNRLIQTGNGAAADALIATSLARHKASTLGSALSLGDLGIEQERQRMLTGASSAADQPETPAHMQIMQDAAAALTTLQGIKDPATRKAAADKMSTDFAARGVPQENIDEITGDLSDAGLKAHADHLSAVASGGDEVPHPTGFAASKGVMANPVYAQAQNSLMQFAGHPWLQAAVEAAGLPIGGAISRDMEITSPERSQEATAANAQQISQANTAGANLANTNPQTAPSPTQGAVRGPNGWEMGPNATNVITAGTNASGLGSTAANNGGRVLYDENHNPVVTPVEGAAGTAGGFHGAVSAGEAGGRAPYSPVEIKMIDNSSIQAIPDGKGGFTQVHPGAGAPTNPGFGAAPSPQQAAAYKASTDQLVADKQSAAQLQAQLAPANEVLRILSAPETTTGPGTQDINHIRSFVQSNLPWLKGVAGANDVQIANMDLLKKYLVRIAASQAAQYGQGTNEKLAVAASGNPNTDMSKLGAQDAMRMNIALMRYDAARPAAYGGKPEGYTDYAANYARTTDPRAFMWDLLSKDERQKVVASVKTPEEKAAMARGFLAAEKAGYFHRDTLR